MSELYTSVCTQQKDFQTAEELLAFICIFGREIRFGILSFLIGKDIYLMPPNILFTVKKSFFYSVIICKNIRYICYFKISKVKTKNVFQFLKDTLTSTYLQDLTGLNCNRLTVKLFLKIWSY
jgi:hypothetical protein